MLSFVSFSVIVRSTSTGWGGEVVVRALFSHPTVAFFPKLTRPLSRVIVASFARVASQAEGRPLDAPQHQADDGAPRHLQPERRGE